MTKKSAFRYLEAAFRYSPSNDGWSAVIQNNEAVGICAKAVIYMDNRYWPYPE